MLPLLIFGYLISVIVCLMVIFNFVKMEEQKSNGRGTRRDFMVCVVVSLIPFLNVCVAIWCGVETIMNSESLNNWLDEPF